MVKKLFIVLTLLLTVPFTVYAQTGDLWQTKGNAVVRESPSTQGAPIHYLKQGVVVTEIEKQNNWLKIKTQSGVEGWVHSSLLAPVTKEQMSQCEGVKGFSAACPVNRKVEINKGESVSVNSTKPQALPFGNLNNIPQAAQKQENAPLDSITLPNNIPVEQASGVVTSSSLQSLQNKNSQSPSSPVSFLENAPEFASQELMGEISGTSFIVGPEKATAVKMSSSDINRVVCPVDIKDVVYSEEKGIQVKISGKNAFVKFLIKKIGTKHDYSNIPVDIYVVCGDKVYSIIAVPDKIPAVTVYLQDKEMKIKETMDKYQGMAYEKQIVNYIKEFMAGRVPPEAEMIRQNKEYNLYQDIKIREVALYTLEGVGMNVRVFHVIASKAVEIKEKDFLRKEITESPLAISLDRLKLNPGERATLLIIESKRG
jgi:hypothetical protein